MQLCEDPGDAAVARHGIHHARTIGSIDHRLDEEECVDQRCISEIQLLPDNNDKTNSIERNVITKLYNVDYHRKYLGNNGIEMRHWK